jgi:hypothetical protein
VKYLTVILLIIASTARGDVLVESTAGDTVVFTNTQAHFYWTPAAMAYTRDNPVPVSVSVYRYGNGNILLLSSMTATSSSLIWIPPAAYQFGPNSALVVVSSVTNFTVQLHRGPVHD